MKTKRIMSKCHYYPHGWSPEAGSPAHERAMEARRQTSAARTSFSKARTPKALSVGSKKNYITGFPS
jgi:hypothetical protein